MKLHRLNDISEKESGEADKALPPDKRIGYAIVGLGHLSLEQILPAFGACKYSKPVALVSGDKEKAEATAAQYGIKHIYSYDNYNDIQLNDEIDAVFIVLPNSMHEEFTVRAAKAGKHVLCEKPMATSAAAARRMISACKDAEKKLMIAYRIQYEPHHAKVKEWMQKYGKVKIIEMFNGQNIGDAPQWRLKKELAGGGALPDIGIYCLNTARYLTGQEPSYVQASTFSTPGDERFREVEESVFFTLHFPGGTVVHASSSYGVHESRRYRCLADKGGWFGMDPAFPYKGLQIEVSQVVDNEVFKILPVIEEKDQFALEIDHMSQCILNNEEPKTPGEEGLRDQLIMEAIYESAETGKAVYLGDKSKLLWPAF